MGQIIASMDIAFCNNVFSLMSEYVVTDADDDTEVGEEGKQNPLLSYTVNNHALFPDIQVYLGRGGQVKMRE